MKYRARDLLGLAGPPLPAAKPSSAGHWTSARDRAAQRRFSRAVLRRYGNRCAWILPGGRRCPVTRGLQAHHTQPGNDDPATGIALCRPHHREIDSHAR